jgi:hypothetical protein
MDTGLRTAVDVASADWRHCDARECVADRSSSAGLVCPLRFLPARQVFFQPAAGRGSTAPGVRPGLGVGYSGGQANDENSAPVPSLRAATLLPLREAPHLF